MNVENQMLLRDLRQDDIPFIVNHASNFNVSRYLTSKFPYPYRTADAIWWVGTGCKYGVHKAIVINGECVGGIGILMAKASTFTPRR